MASRTGHLMITAFRWLLRLFTAMVVLSVVALLVVYYILGRSLPNYSTTFALTGIKGPVEIIRNNNNVPHIFGKSDELAEHGASVAFTYVSSDEKAKALEAKLMAMGVKAKAYKSNAGVYEDCEAMVNAFTRSIIETVLSERFAT